MCFWFSCFVTGVFISWSPCFRMPYPAMMMTETPTILTKPSTLTWTSEWPILQSCIIHCFFGYLQSLRWTFYWFCLFDIASMASIANQCHTGLQFKLWPPSTRLYSQNSVRSVQLVRELFSNLHVHPQKPHCSQWETLKWRAAGRMIKWSKLARTCVADRCLVCGSIGQFHSQAGGGHTRAYSTRVGHTSVNEWIDLLCLDISLITRPGAASAWVSTWLQSLRCFSHQLFHSVAVEMQTQLRTKLYLKKKKRPVLSHSCCDLAVFPSLTPDAFCFLLPPSVLTHTHLLPLCLGSLLDAAGRRWVSAGPRFGLFIDCLSLVLLLLLTKLCFLSTSIWTLLYLYCFSSFFTLHPPHSCSLQAVFPFSSPASISLMTSAADQSEQKAIYFVHK